MVRSVEELQEIIRGRIGDDTSTDDLSIWEDITDTVTDMAARLREVDQRIADKEREWRERYIARFRDSIGNVKEEKSEDETKVKEQDEITIEDLFDNEEGD